MMTDLDFAFINMLPHDKKRLGYKENLLNLLAPFFSPPRLQRFFRLKGLNTQGGNILLPLGPGQMAKMHEDYKKKVIKYAFDFLSAYTLPVLAVDRRLKNIFSKSKNNCGIIYGDYFILALAYVLIHAAVLKYPVDRIILAGSINGCYEFLEAVCMLGLPVAIQNYNPVHEEILAYNLLYSKGIVLNVGFFDPYQITDKDIVIFFDAQLYTAALSVPRKFYIQLTDSSENLAPLLEQELRLNRMDFRLHHLAPILETCLLLKAGYFSSGNEKTKTEPKKPVDFKILQKIGYDLCLWELFLDKAV
ncbi:MAG: hypothetical protein LBR98_00215 [Syntrophomonadaceae bacterium]|jgi:hypothetical protein|nr:hypothetical protein [Syntrophomonadaceae bacterium]